MTRRKFTSKFKTKVVLEALKERQTTQELAQKFDITSQQINLWKREFLSEAEAVFDKGTTSKKSESAAAIKSLIQDACIEHQPEKLQFLTDGGSENVNSIVSDFINSPDIPTKHIVAQKDMVFSNSMIEAVNKTIKH